MIIFIYLLGLFIALMWLTYAYYSFNVRNGKDVRYIFDDDKDVMGIFLFALGSWLAVMLLLLSDDEDNEN